MQTRKYVSEKEYRDYINQFSIIREKESIHRDDTDFHTYALIDNCEVLIGWADYYWKYWYIFTY
ncbi:TPA: hypothetical protein MDW71_005289 [Klebsiella pneumoniae]|nr:hypothetical protein [Klebsiella pneumoniae]